MTNPVRDDPRRRIPPVDRLLADSALGHLIGLYGREVVRVQARGVLDEVREELAAADGQGDADQTPLTAIDQTALTARVARRVEEVHGRPFRRVINATGIFIHTNLGRSPLPRDVAAALPALLDAYGNLEMDLDTGRRSDRNRRVGPLLTALTGAEAATVVNNNAAAMVLALSALLVPERRRVIVSRGELVEIGGSFRIPDMLAASGAELVEVGTTNRVRLADYARAIDGGTALLLKVFPSNYRVVGFTAAVPPRELASLARARDIPLLVDEGSGLLRPHPAPQLADHPSVRELVESGCDLVTSSGDKLLGGPQAGLLVGRAEWVERCRRHPLYRSFRPDRATYATLEAVLRRHLRGDPMPVDGLWPDPEDHDRRLERVIGALPEARSSGNGGSPHRVPADAYLGGGSAPERPIPGEAIAIPGGDGLLRRLRTGETPVVGYVREGRVILDLRTVDPDDDADLVAAVVAAIGPARPPAEPADGAA
jgi:L-seryl-tRNA(Ser) seleniumtransferase